MYVHKMCMIYRSLLLVYKFIANIKYNKITVVILVKHTATVWLKIPLETKLLAIQIYKRGTVQVRVRFSS